MKFELEKQSRGYPYSGYPDREEILATSDSYEELEKIANKIRLRCGVTYYQVLVLNELDDVGDIVDVSQIRQCK